MRDIALLALLYGVGPISRNFNIDESLLTTWVMNIQHDPFLKNLRNHILTQINTTSPVTVCKKYGLSSKVIAQLSEFKEEFEDEKLAEEVFTTYEPPENPEPNDILLNPSLELLQNASKITSPLDELFNSITAFPYLIAEKWFVSEESDLERIISDPGMFFDGSKLEQAVPDSDDSSSQIDYEIDEIPVFKMPEDIERNGLEGIEKMGYMEEMEIGLESSEKDNEYEYEDYD